MEKFISLLQEASAELERLTKNGELTIKQVNEDSIRIMDKDGNLTSTYNEYGKPYMSFCLEGKNEHFSRIISASKEEILNNKIAELKAVIEKLKGNANEN